MQCRFAAINAGLEAGFLKPVSGKFYSLADAPAAHTEVIAQASGSAGKIVIHPW